MATSSFDRDFVIKDPKAIKKFRKAMKNPAKIVVEKRDFDKEQKEGLELLKKSLSI